MSIHDNIVLNVSGASKRFGGVQANRRRSCSRIRTIDRWGRQSMQAREGE